MNGLDLVRLSPLMNRSAGRREVKVGLIDGPVALGHPDLVGAVVEISGSPVGSCALASSAACMHGTFVAGILVAKRGSAAPAICPACTLLLRPIFPESADHLTPSASSEQLAAAIADCVESGARVINISAALSPLSAKAESALKNAVAHALRSGVLLVAAAGNQGLIGSSAITREQWIIPVVACDSRGQPLNSSNLGSSIARRGLRAPGNVTSIASNGGTVRSEGTSAAAALVTGAIALLSSEFPTATSSEIRLALSKANAARQTSVVPPLLDAWSAFETLHITQGRTH
jgi:subtilisin family serine protease